MEYSKVKPIVDKWITDLSPACERIEPAGSYRRGKAEPRDIEIVCKPHTMTEPDLFGQPTEVNFLEEFIYKVATSNGATFLKNGPKYKQLALAEGIHLDLFIVLPPAEWGVQFMIRTGPSDFSHWMVTPRQKGGGLPSYLRVKEGAIWRYDQKLITPEESDVFKVLGMEYIEPGERRARWMVTA